MRLGNKGFLIILIGLVLLMSFIFAAEEYTVRYLDAGINETNITVVEDVTHFYNISIWVNTTAANSGNISEINITLPADESTAKIASRDPCIQYSQACFHRYGSLTVRLCARKNCFSPG